MGPKKIRTLEQMNELNISVEEPEYNIINGFSELAKAKGWYNGNALVFAMKENWMAFQKNEPKKWDTSN